MGLWDFIRGRGDGIVGVTEAGEIVFRAKGGELVKAQARATEATRTAPKGIAPESWDLDPLNYALFAQHEALAGDAHPGTVGLNFETLRWMSRVPLISAIVGTRINQVAEYAVPQENPYIPGFKMRMRRRSQSPSQAARRKMEDITAWVQSCGAREITRDNNFEAFTRKAIRDSMQFEAMGIEKVRTRGNKLAGFVAVDATTLRKRRVTDEDRKKGRRSSDSSGYVQIMNNKVVAQFPTENLVYGVRRPRTWIEANGYGYPELEELVRTVTNIVNAEAYNAANFTHGMHAAGILAVKTKMDPGTFRAFRREFYSMLRGASSAHKTPVIQLDPEAKEELQNINLSSTNKEMEFSNWISWLLRIACNVWQIDASELGYQYGNEGQATTLVGDSGAAKIAHSRERGLRPLLRWYQTQLNLILEELEPDFELVFGPLTIESEAERLERAVKASQHLCSVNEARKMFNEEWEDLDNPVADIGPTDPTYMNLAYQEMKEEQGADEDELPAEGENDDFDLDGFFTVGDDQFDPKAPEGQDVEDPFAGQVPEGVSSQVADEGMQKALRAVVVEVREG